MPGDVFISYAREDTDFVRRLHGALAAHSRDAWVDWEDIPLTADWWREIQAGIEAAEAFVFIISPDSAQSEVCYREIDHAAQHNKRIMPIMHRLIADPLLQQKLHPAVNAHNWVFFRDTDDFDKSFQALIDAMDTDLSYVREHTRLLVRARSWEAAQHDSSQLLRGNDLSAAEAWLAGGQTKAHNKPSELHIDYIRRSRRAQNRRFQRTVGLSILVAIIVGLMIVSLLLRQEAEQKRDEAARSAEEARIAQEEAVQQGLVSKAIGLAAQAQLELFGSFPERGVLLALEALDSELPYVWQADRALGAAVQISRARSIFAEHEGQVLDVAWSPDGTRVVTASVTVSGSGSAIIWDAASGEQRFTLSGHTDVVTSVAWSPDSQYIVTGSRDATAKIWDAATGTELDTLFGHGNEWVNDVAWSPDGALIATASNDTTVKLWTAADRVAAASRTPDAYSLPSLESAPAEATLTLVGHEKTVKGVDWLPDGTALVTVSEDQTIRIWNAVDGAERLVFGSAAQSGDSGHTDGINSVDWAGNGALILTGSRDDTAKVWDAATGALVVTLTQHVSDITGVKFAPDSVTFATTSKDRTIRAYNTATGDLLFTASGHSNDVTSVDWSPDGRRLVTSSEDKTARAWDTLPGNTPVALRGHTGRVTGADWSPEGSLVVTVSTDGTARLWDAKSGGELIVFENARSGANSAAWSPDGKYVALITRSRTVQLRDPATGDAALTIDTGGTPNSVAWSDDRTMVITPIGVSLVAWDAVTGAEIKRLETTSQILWADLSPDGQRLLTLTGRDKAVTVWDFVTGQLLLRFELHVDTVNDAAWSPDGTRIVSGDAEGTARIWDASTGASLQLLNGHTDGIMGVAWSPDGARVITASRDRSARVWAADTGNELLVLNGHTDELADVVWSPTGDHAVTTSGDQTANVWPVWLTANDLAAFARECCVFRELTPEERVQFDVQE